MDYKEYTAKSVDETITQACLDLGVTSDRLDYDVLQEASSGFLGIGSKPAIIRARVRTEEELEKERTSMEEAEKAQQESVVTKALQQPEKKIITSDEIEKRAAAAAAKAKAEGRSDAPVKPEKHEGGRRERNRGRDRKNNREHEVRFEEPPVVPAYEPSKPKPERVVKPVSEEKAEELKKTAEDFLKSVFDAMHIEAGIETEYSQEEGAVNCTFDGEEMGILIGKRGQTLDSLQYLTSLVVNKKAEDYVRVKLDTEDYRARRADTLNNLARNIAYKVKKTHRPLSLEPMNPYERRIIHSSLQGNRFVETYSEGEEPYRHVVVTPKR